ncbi:hypothetical protein ACUOFC_61460, partial [Escherichia sp. TWPC-MK]
KIGGEGELAINTVRQVSLSNGQNDYQGATYVQMGTLRTDADGALGNTRELNISNAAIVDLTVGKRNLSHRIDCQLPFTTDFCRH